MIRDFNGNRVQANVRREDVGGRQLWGATVWFGGLYGVASDVRRYYYATRAAARRGSISDTPGKRGRVA